MSKINAIRLINVNYNRDAIHVSDETLHLNGKSTLISLQNGGGKSVLVQLLTAPFVQKRYRNVKERPFYSYFGFLATLDGQRGKLFAAASAHRAVLAHAGRKIADRFGHGGAGKESCHRAA